MHAVNKIQDELKKTVVNSRINNRLSLNLVNKWRRDDFESELIVDVKKTKSGEQFS